MNPSTPVQIRSRLPEFRRAVEPEPSSDQVRSAGIPSASPQKRLVLAFWVAALGLALVEGWLSRFAMYSDGISYLDIGDAVLHGEWSAAVNAYWSPLYPCLLAFALGLLKPAARLEFPVVHLVNFFVFAFALAGFHFFLTGLIRFLKARQASGKRPVVTLSDSSWLILGYALFLWSALKLISVSVVSPDMCVAACMYVASGALLRIAAGSAGFRQYALLGFALGLGYLSKAPVFPLAILYLVLSARAPRHFLWALPRALTAVLIFAAIAGPLVYALSKTSGHLTFGESGNLNVAWYVNGIPRYHWQGQPPGSGTPRHSTQKIFEKPLLYAFAGPVRGTYPIWYDPAYWFSGIRARFSPKSLSKQVLLNGLEYYDIFFRLQGVVIAGCLILLFMAPQPGSVLRALTANWLVWLPPLVALAMYAPVHVEKRMTGAFVVMLWAALFGAVRLRYSAFSRKLVYNVALAIAVLLMVSVTASTLGEMASHDLAGLTHLDDPRVPSYRVVESLRANGLRPGDKIAWIRPHPFNSRQDYWWARLARLRIVAEVPAGHEDEFWVAANPATLSAVAASLRATGAKALVATAMPAGASRVSWKQLGSTGYYIYPLSE